MLFSGRKHEKSLSKIVTREFNTKTRMLYNDSEAMSKKTKLNAKF